MTQKEAKILADIRNKYTPILTFFNLCDQVVYNTTLTIEQKQDIYSMILRDEGKANESVKEVAKLLKSLG